MPRARWPLKHDRPSIDMILTFVQGGQKVTRSLLADTGAGTAQASFEILLDESDCLLCGSAPTHTVSLGGAYAGAFPVCIVRIEIPSLAVARAVLAVGVPNPPQGFDGIACFRFLSEFAYFGDAASFGLEV